MLEGIDWDKYKGEYALGVTQHGFSEPDITVGRPEEKSSTDEHYYGYHSTNVGPDVILKEGLKGYNPLDQLGLDEGEKISKSEKRAATGVYFHTVPHTEYGEHLYRIAIPHTQEVSGDMDRMGEGYNTVGKRGIPAKNVEYLGHGSEGARDWSDFHATSLPPEKCPACIIEGVHYQHLAERNAGQQFTES